MFYVVNYVPPARLKKINVQARIYASCNKIDRVDMRVVYGKISIPPKRTPPVLPLLIIFHTLYTIYTLIYIYIII